MTWLVESPWPSVVSAAVVEAVLAIVLLRTGRGAVAVAMGVVLVIALGLVWLERMIVTEHEEVEDSLAAVASALESNNVTGVLAGFTANFPRRGEIERALARFKIREAHVGRDLEIRLNQLTSPPSATAYFTGHIEGKDTRGEFPYEHVIRRFKVVFHKQDGKWLIADYSDEDMSLRKSREGRDGRRP